MSTSTESATPAEQVRERLAGVLAAGAPVIGAGAGTGLSAKAAVHGGADLILVYNSGRFRMAGIGSNADTLPLGDANAIMMDMGEREILPVVPDVPVIAGVNGTDPTRNMPRFLQTVLDAGFAGVINWQMASVGVDVVVAHLGTTVGGPIATPADVRVVLGLTSAEGFVGASTMERLPVEQAIGDTVRAFKDVPLRDA
jgi:predicted TIM-barrel enzyme